MPGIVLGTVLRSGKEKNNVEKGDREGGKERGREGVPLGSFLLDFLRVQISRGSALHLYCHQHLQNEHLLGDLFL